MAGGPAAPEDREAAGRWGPDSALCLSPEHRCSVFYGAPAKSKLLSTLCSADVCQCAEGETGLRACGRAGGALTGLTSSPLGPDLREVPSAAARPGAGAGGRRRLQDEVRLLLPPRGLRSVCPSVLRIAGRAASVAGLRRPLCSDATLQPSAPG